MGAFSGAAWVILCKLGTPPHPTENVAVSKALVTVANQLFFGAASVLLYLCGQEGNFRPAPEDTGFVGGSPLCQQCVCKWCSAKVYYQVPFARGCFVGGG